MIEPLDVLQSVAMLLRQLEAKEAKVENQYRRVVPWEGNRAALRAMAEVFTLRSYFEWRGMGFISQSALALCDSSAEWDAEKRFHVPGIRVTDPQECTPERPVGALMVSSEGACAAYYQYEHRKTSLVSIPA